MATSIDRSDSRRLMIFAGRTSRALAESIGACLGVELGAVEATTFASGEIYVRYGESIRGADVFLVQSVCGPVNDSLVELLLMIDAARLASARRIVAVIPYYGYARQDKKSAPREPISARLMADLLEAAGADRVLSMDLHAGQIQGFFRIPVDHMTAEQALVDHFLARADVGEIEGPLAIVSPDVGRAKLCNHVAQKLDAAFAVVAKRRPRPGAAEVTLLIGDVRDHTAIMLDDMIDTGGTLAVAADALRAAGARRVLAAATHGVFSGDAFGRLEAAAIEEVVVTDTIPLEAVKPEAVRPDWLTVVPVGRILADCIRSVFDDTSVSEIFAGENQLF
jgi:ribose-phosphate pyrophosphokinase